MARTFKLEGIAYSTGGDVSITVNFNSNEVYSGTVTTNVVEAIPENTVGTDDALIQPLCQWDEEYNVNGLIPLTITASGGTVFWTGIRGNYLNEDRGTVIEPDASSEYWADLNENSYANGDGTYNLTINGEHIDNKFTGDEADWLDGDGHYKIENAQTLSCDFLVQYSLLYDPTPPATP